MKEVAKHFELFSSIIKVRYLLIQIKNGLWALEEVIKR
jgi:hypothetical protein